MRKTIIFFIAFLVIAFSGFAQNKPTYKIAYNLSYYEQTTDDYQKSQCLVDIYYPESETKKPIIVWFHGGGLTSGKKEIPEYLKEKEFVVVGVGYRFSPKVKVETIIHDAAKAISWIYKNAEKYNGDKDKLFISGHSAGGYLALMVGLDKSYLHQYETDANRIAGIISFSGQAITHFTARKEMGIAETQPSIDKLSPLFWVRKDAPPIILLTGDREKEMLGRYEENAYLKRMLNLVGHPDVKLMEFQGYGHNMTYPAFPIMVDEVKRLLK